MTNLYDIAYKMEAGLRNHDDIITLINLSKEISDDQAANTLLENFRSIQMQFQMAQMSGQEPTEEQKVEYEETINKARQDERIVKLMEAEQRASVLINDLTKIIMKPIEEIYGANK